MNIDNYIGGVMPSTVIQLLTSGGAELSGKIQWGQDCKSYSPGIYIVSTSEDENQNKGTLPKAPISLEMVKFWINKVSTIELDHVKNPRPESICDRLSEFWLPDENILYIGRTTAKLGQRLEQYYDTELGDRSPHAGGHWIKTLSNLNEFYVYYAECAEPRRIEGNLMEFFIRDVSKTTLSRLRDAKRPFPFANLEYPKGNRKLHGIGKSRLK